mgnify:CR=1 FL=1
MEYVLSDRKLLPYGMMNFEDIRLDNYYYVDKTAFIPLIEQSDRFFFFIRPRRFGKSLTLNMLQHYYDIRTKDKFDALFGDLYIGKHPTKDRNSYLVIKLNFSGISGDLHSYRKGLDEHCKIVFDYFCDVYADYLPEGIKEKMNEKDGAVSQFEYLFTECARVNQKIYLFIDEYDHFTNTILSDVDSMNRYTDETHKEGYLRAFFNKIKSGTDSSIKRCFITGVSPVTMDDLTSGFNIGWNISTDHQFNMMLGFSETDVREMIQYYKDAGQLPGNTNIDAMIEEMRPWYDNYCFAEESLERDPKMFNCDMVFYYLRHYMTLGKSPKEMIDPNTRTDYNKMKKLIRLDKLDGNRKGVLRKITEDGQIVTTLTTTFPATDITKPEIFPSLLFYYGMLTITATRGNYLVLSIPNNNVRKQYYEFLLEEYQDNRHINLNDLGLMYYEMAYDGHWRETLEFIAHAYKENSSVRNAIEGERNLQGFFTAYLSTNAYYLIAPEVELNHGYCDLFLMPDLIRYDVKHSYIIELKYLSVKDSEAKAEAQWQEAVEQIKGYAVGPKVRQMVHATELHCIVMQFRGWELERMEEV